jgi:hypothetical protein
MATELDVTLTADFKKQRLSDVGLNLLIQNNGQWQILENIAMNLGII